MHEARVVLQDTLTCDSHRVTLREAGQRLFPNSERHLRSRAELGRLYPRALLDESVAIARRCHFSLDELRYQYPHEIVPPGLTPTVYLRQLVEEGAAACWPDGVPPPERALIDKELAIIAELQYEPFFLTVYEWSASRARRDRHRAAVRAPLHRLLLPEGDRVVPDHLQMLFERSCRRSLMNPGSMDFEQSAARKYP